MCVTSCLCVCYFCYYDRCDHNVTPGEKVNCHLEKLLGLLRGSLVWAANPASGCVVPTTRMSDISDNHVVDLAAIHCKYVVPLAVFILQILLSEVLFKTCKIFVAGMLP